MKTIFKLFFLIFSLTIFLNANEVIDINKKIEQAKNENKSLMFFFHVPDCPFCERMLSENFKDEKTLKLIDKNFIFVDIYTANKNDYLFNKFKGSAKEFAKLTKAFAYPATLFMDTNGKVIYKAIGYRNIKEYIFEIKYVTTKSYNKMPLDEFIVKMEMEDE